MTKPHIPLDEIRAQVEGCRKCPLADGRTQTVFGVGNPEARVMIIGEAPGKNEDLQGEPFVGAAGKYLNELLAVAGLVREDVFIANVLKCRPPGNRDPRPEEIELCTPYLREQTRTIDPEFLVTLGNFSTKFILKTDIGITRLHGTVQRAGKFKVFPIFHPAAALYDGSKREALENDFATLGELLRASEASYSPVNERFLSIAGPFRSVTKKQLISFVSGWLSAQPPSVRDCPFGARAADRGRNGKKHRIRNASQALSKRRARHQKKCSSQSGIMRVVIRSTVGSQSIPGGNFRIRCFFAIWAFVGCAGGGEALQPLLALEDDDFDHDDDYRYGDDGFVAPAPVKAGHVREIHAEPAGQQRQRREQRGDNREELHRVVLLQVDLRLVQFAQLQAVLLEGERALQQAFGLTFRYQE